jgi:hypothetical protein
LGWSIAAYLQALEQRVDALRDTLPPADGKAAVPQTQVQTAVPT